MSSGEAAMSFVVDYEMSVDDLRERDIVGRLAAWRAKPLWSQWAYPVLLLAFVAATVYFDRALSRCFIPLRGMWVVQEQCDPTMTPSGLLWQNGGLFVADGVFFMLTLTELGRAWERPARWRYRMAMKRDGLSQRYRYEFAADGLTVARPDGAISYVPWPVFTAVRETRERFLLCGREYGWGWVLPKRALADPASVQQLGEFLRASVGREPPPASPFAPPGPLRSPAPARSQAACGLRASARSRPGDVESAAVQQRVQQPAQPSRTAGPSTCGPAPGCGSRAEACQQWRTATSPARSR